MPKDAARAFQLVEQGARLRCCHCQGMMSRCLAGGFGCAKDSEQSRKLARDSAAAGSRCLPRALPRCFFVTFAPRPPPLFFRNICLRYGQYMAGWLQHTGWGGCAKDLGEALAHYRSAAQQVRQSARAKRVAAS